MSRTLVLARHFRTFAAIAVVAAAPVSLTAQQAAVVDDAAPAPTVTAPITDPAPTPAATPAPSSVMYQSTAVAARTTTRDESAASRQAAANAAARADNHVGAGTNAALMVVGAAGLLTGLIVGGGAGTAIAVGGTLVGLYGLFRFLQ